MSQKLTVKDVMSKPVSIAKSALIPEALSKMLENGIDPIVVTHDHVVVGTASEIMTAADIKTVTSSTSVADAAKLMLEYGVGVFPVLDGDELSGIVTEFDLVKALAE